jgi:hypothetical protein
VEIARRNDLAGIVSQQHGISAKRALDTPARPGVLDFDTSRYPMFHHTSPDETGPRKGLLIPVRSCPRFA